MNKTERIRMGVFSQKVSSSHGRHRATFPPAFSSQLPFTLSARFLVTLVRFVFSWVDTFWSTSNHLPMGKRQEECPSLFCCIPSTHQGSHTHSQTTILQSQEELSMLLFLYDDDYTEPGSSGLSTGRSATCSRLTQLLLHQDTACSAPTVAGLGG